MVTERRDNMIKNWIKATAVRTIKTFAECAIAMIPAGMRLEQIGWLEVLSVSATAAVICILSCIPGLPEVKKEAEG